jgi:large subunit ribosomal protein L10
LPSDKNLDALEELKGKLSSNSVLIGTGFTGLDVATMTEFRQKLREQDLEYRVVKNTIASLAADEIGSPQIKEILSGPTGLVLGNGDPVAAAKLLTDYLRATRIAMPLNGAVMDGQVMSAADVNALGLLPPKPVLMAMLTGQLAGVVARLVRALNGPMQNLAVVLERSTEGKIEAPAAESTAPVAEAAPAEEAPSDAPETTDEAPATEGEAAPEDAGATDAADETADESPAEDSAEEAPAEDSAESSEETGK